jgi:hypothetical protein
VDWLWLAQWYDAIRISHSKYVFVLDCAACPSLSSTCGAEHSKCSTAHVPQHVLPALVSASYLGSCLVKLVLSKLYGVSLPYRAPDMCGSVSRERPRAIVIPSSRGDICSNLVSN